MRISLLNVPIDAVTRSEARAKVVELLGENKGHLVTTPNPEMLVLADREPLFREALAAADLSIPDGIGLLHVARIKGLRIPERITGTDFMSDITEIASAKRLRVFFLGGRGEAAAKAATVLSGRYPGLQVVGAEDGGDVTVDANGEPSIDLRVEERIRSAAPHILFVAFGHGKQERWIHQKMGSFPSVRLAMGVGGAFDFYAGNVRRAPQAFRYLGIEWLWRLFVEPWRFNRIWTAVVIFPLLAFRHRT